MVDATIVPVPKHRNTREEDEAVKAGETPKDWARKPAKNRQKDKDGQAKRTCVYRKPHPYCAAARIT